MVLTMMALVLGQVVVAVDGARGVSDADRQALVAALERAVTSTVAREPSTLRVRIIGAPSRIRVIAERSTTAGLLRRAQVDLPREPDAWPGALAGMLESLFPPAPRREPEIGVSLLPARPPEIGTTRVASAPIEPAGPSIRAAPLIALGGSAAAFAVALAFGASSAAARTEGETELHTDAEQEALQSRLYSHGLAANVLFVVAGAGALAGAILWIGDLP